MRATWVSAENPPTGAPEPSPAAAVDAPRRTSTHNSQPNHSGPAKALAVLRTSIFYLGYVPVSIGYGIFAIPLYLLPKRHRHRIMNSWCHLVVQWLRLTCGVRFRIEGLSHLRELQRPAVVLSKHQSTWETYCLQWLCWPAATVLKQELLKLPFFGWGLRHFSPIAIDRDNPRAALRQVREQSEARLASGLNVLLFPEGTRAAVGTRGRYARSGPEIALATGAPMLPVAVNAGHLWAPGTFIKYPGEVSVVFGAPMDPAGKTSRELINAVETWIETRMALLDGAPTAKEIAP